MILLAAHVWIFFYMLAVRPAGKTSIENQHQSTTYAGLAGVLVLVLLLVCAGFFPAG